jgi:hypothetical protein
LKDDQLGALGGIITTKKEVKRGQMGGALFGVLWQKLGGLA